MNRRLPAVPPRATAEALSVRLSRKIVESSSVVPVAQSSARAIEIQRQDVGNRTLRHLIQTEEQLEALIDRGQFRHSLAWANISTSLHRPLAEDSLRLRVNSTPTITLHVPGPLRAYCCGVAELSMSAHTVRATLEVLERSESR